MEYTIKAIPTVYRETEFRSRLEATWASFFDLCGIPWEYEPFDLEGWAPDFLLHAGGEKVFAEVKPVENPSRALDQFEKATRFRGKHWILLLGRRPVLESIGHLTDEPTSPGTMSSLEKWLTVEAVLCPVHGHERDELWRRAGNITRWKGPRP